MIQSAAKIELITKGFNSYDKDVRIPENTWFLFFSFPMELHMVFYKKEYGDPKGALEHKDGLAVLAFFYEVNTFLFSTIIH